MLNAKFPKNKILLIAHNLFLTCHITHAKKVHE